MNENISINTFIFFSAINSLIMTKISTLDALKSYGSFCNYIILINILKILLALLLILLPSCIYFLVGFNPKL